MIDGNAMIVFVKCIYLGSRMRGVDLVEAVGALMYVVTVLGFRGTCTSHMRTSRLR
jgi:hypothetical protein